MSTAVAPQTASRTVADPVYTFFCIVWLGAVAARWTLSSSQTAEQIPWMLLLTVAGVWQVRRRTPIPWMLSALAIAVPYFFMRDWLTQSLVMLLTASVAALTVRRDDPRSGTAVLQASYLITAFTYLAAAMHKLNEGFFDSATGCAAYGMDRLDILLPWFPLATTGVLRDSLPWLVVGTEVLIAVLLVVRPRHGMVLGLLFHIPLTLVFAPAFVFVMLIGYAARLREDEVHSLALVLNERLVPLLAGFAVSVVLTAVSIDTVTALHAETQWHRADLWQKVPIILVLTWVLLEDQWRRWRLRGSDDGSAWSVPPSPTRPWSALPFVATGIFVVMSITPYLGTQMQHTGAMLSNLRIDEPCWNHLFVSGSYFGDPYIRVDEASIGNDPDDLIDEYTHKEELLEARLWSSPQFEQIRRNWCAERMRPIMIRGTQFGEPFEISDVCDLTIELPRDRGAFGGRAWFSDYLRLQKNLPRTCNMRCMH